MDEMTQLRELRAEAPTPDRTRLVPGRERLLQGAGKRTRLHGAARRRLTVIGAAAAVTVAALVTAQLPDGGDRGAAPPAASQDGDTTTGSDEARAVLRKAAEAAAAQPDPEPRTGKWVYVKRVRGVADAPGDHPPFPKKVKEHWFRCEALEDDWREGDDWLSPRSAYVVMEELPEEPEKLFAKALKWYPPRDTDDGRQARFEAAQYLLQMPLGPPEGLAKIYRALAELEGITVADHLVTGPRGEKALAVYYDGESETREQILIDPQTYRLVGFRTLQLQDAQPPEGHPDLPVYEAGDVVSNGVVAEVGIVDRKGQRP